MPAWRDVKLDLESNRPMWYLWPVACPMQAAKVAAGHPKPMACIGGVQDPEKGLGVFTCCWHTDKDAVQKNGDAITVECRYNPDTDRWNRPMGKVDPTAYKPPQLGGDTEPLSAVLARVLSGAPEGPLRPRED